PDLGAADMLQRNDLVEDRAESLRVLLVDDGDERGRISLELAQHRCEQQLAHLESLLGLVAQLDQLQHPTRLVRKTPEPRTACRTHDRDVMAKPPHLVLHQLAVLRSSRSLKRWSRSRNSMS